MSTKAALRIVSINDVYELTNLPRLRTLVRSVTSPDVRTLTFVNGDFLSPSLLSSMDKGRSMVQCLNRVPVTHVCFGNHEGDVGLAEMKRRVQEFQGLSLTAFFQIGAGVLGLCVL